MRVIVTGSRTWTDEQPIRTILDGLAYKAMATSTPLTVIHGACPTGADRHAHDWVADCFTDDLVREESHPADWARHGRAAGPIRNQQMADTGADLLVAFAAGHPTDPVSRGTADMIRRAEHAGILVWTIRTGGEA